MFEKESHRTNETQQSISFAESLSDNKLAPGKGAPSYSVANQENEKGGKKSKQTAGNDGQKTYETGGSITFYCNGFLMERDLAGNEGREERAKADDNKNGEVVYDNNSEIEGGESYWSGIEGQMEERFTGKAPNADSTFYLDASDAPWTSAADRMKDGHDAAAKVIEKVKAGQFKLNQNGELPDAINIVGHSMGGAYAAGLAKGLLEYNEQQGKEVFKVRAVYYFAPHQPMDIEHPSEVRGVQYSHKNDTVSSNADAKGLSTLYGGIPKFTGSRVGPIGGIHEYMEHDVPGLSQSLLSDRGGHNVSDHQYVLSKYGQGFDGHVAANDDKSYDKDNYKHQVKSQDGYKKAGFSLPNVLDDLEALPDVLRGKVDEAESWVSDQLTKGREAIDRGKEWADSKVEEGTEYAHDKIGEGDEWLDEKIDQGDEFLDEKMDELVEKARKENEFLGVGAGILRGILGNKKDKGVQKVRDKKAKVRNSAHDIVNKVSGEISKASNDLYDWVTTQTDKLSSYITNGVAKISNWAKSQITKYEKKGHILAKKIQRKIRALIKKVMKRIERIKKKAGKYEVVINELKQWD